MAGLPDMSAAPNPFRPVNLEQIAAALDTAAAKATGDPSKVSVAALTNAVSPFYTPLEIGVGRAASKLGCPSTFQMTPAAPPTPDGGVPVTGSDIQSMMFQTLIDQKYRGISLSPNTNNANDEMRVATLITSAQAGGANVTMFDTDLPASGRALYIGTDNFTAGQSMGKQISMLLGGTGKIVPYSTGTGANIVARYNGIVDAVKGTAIVVAPLVYLPSGADPQATAAKIMTDNPDMSAFACLNSRSGPPAAAAVVAATKTGSIKVIAFDSLSATQQYLQMGVIQMIIGQRPYWEGYITADVLYTMAQLGVDATKTLLQPWLTGPGLDVIDTGIDVVTKDTLAEYSAYLESIGIQTQ
jgi:ribose transport system substrate-binding protein